MKKTLVAAIDFGTNKIVTLAAENSSSQRCDIVGAGVASYDGYLQDSWNNPDLLDESIRKSISDAETQCGQKIREIYIGVPGQFTRIYATEAKVQLSGTDPRVTTKDIKKAFSNASENLKDIQGVVIHSSPAWFRVDSGKKTLEPVGMKGRELTALISIVVADRFFVDDVNMRLINMDYFVKAFYSTSVGEAMLYLSEQDRDKTAVLIDIGYLNTEIMTVEGDALIYHEMIGMGGGHISAALSDKLDISLQDAEEKIKRYFVYELESPNETYELPGVDGQRGRVLTREEVKPIIYDVMDELSGQIKDKLEENCNLGNWSSVFLTGGGLACNKGGKEYLHRRLGRPVQDTPKRTLKMVDPMFNSTLGLMDLIIDSIEQDRQATSGAGGKIKSFFRGLLGG